MNCLKRKCPPPIVIKVNTLNSTVLILLFLFTFTQVVRADQSILTTKVDNYYDWQGIQRMWTESNLLDYPIYDIIDNGNNYTIRKFNITSGNYDTINLPKRNYLTYNFGIDTISVSGTILNQSQAVGGTQFYNATVRYLPLPFSASQIKSVTDDLIDMGLFKRYVNFNIIDSAGVEYNFEKHVIGNEIRLYFLTADFSTATYPIYINENTLVVQVANTIGVTGEKAQLASDTCCDTENVITGANKGTSAALSSAELNSLSVNDSTTSEVTQAGTASKDERININFTLSGVQSVNWVDVKVMLRRTGANDGTRIGVWNYSTALYQGVKTLGGSTSYQLFNYNISSSVEKTAYLKLTASTLEFSVVGWGYGGSSDTIASTYFEAIIDYVPLTYIPPTPVNIANTSGYYWVNHSVQAGIGNVTDIFNKSVKINNGALTWYNNSALFLNTSGSAGDTINTTFYAYNSTGNGGTFNTTGIWQNTTIPSTPPTDTSFTVTLPVGYTYMTFSPPNSTAKYFYPTGQTSSIPFLNITNNGNIAQTFRFYLNATISNIDLYADLNNVHSSGTILINTTTTTAVVSNLASLSSQNVWMFSNFSRPIPQNTNKTLTINSSS